MSTIALPFLVPFSRQIWYVDSFCQEQEQVLSMEELEVIYAHARDLTSGFLTPLLKMPLNAGLQAKGARLIGNRGCERKWK